MGCAYVERDWRYAGRDLPLGAPVAPGRLQADLADCVASRDPARLHELAGDGQYRTAGIVLDDGPPLAVFACMREKRWVAMQRTVLFP